MIWNKLHVVDPDPGRRARVAFDLSPNYSTQVYESVDELIAFGPQEGILFVNDDVGCDPLPFLHAHFAKNGNALPVALYSKKPETPRVVEAVFSGAVDYLEWPFENDVLRAAFDRIVTRFATLNGARGKRNAAINKVGNLSKREKHTLQLLIQGNSSKQIAMIMGISPRTVEIHRANVLKKLDAASTPDAVRIGLYAGLEDDDFANQ